MLPLRSMNFLVGFPRRGLAGVLLVALAGFGATAFGVAINMPEPKLPPQRWLSEAVTPLDVGPQFEVLAAHPLELYRNDVTRFGDSAASLLARLNVVDPPAVQFLRTDALSRTLFDGRAGKSVRVRTDASGRMLELVARFAALDRGRSSSHFSRLRIERVADRLMATIETAAFAPQVKVGSGTVITSLFAATDTANVPRSQARWLKYCRATWTFTATCARETPFHSFTKPSRPTVNR